MAYGSGPRKLSGGGQIGLTGKSIKGSKVGKVSLRSRFPEIIAKLPVQVDVALFSGAETIAEIARQKAPVQTGRLRDSIKASKVGAKANRVQVRAAWYWYLLEHGTVNMPARPFMTASAEEGAPALAVEVARFLKRL